jgi:hypothetical protein
VTRLARTTALFLAALVACNEQLDYRDEYACHTTEHFEIYYEEGHFSAQELVGIGERKERLLAYIEREMQVTVHGTIVCYLLDYDSYASGWTSWDGDVHESRSYVLTDDGHEIVHAVTFRTMGSSRNRFMLEGLAMCLELNFGNFSAIQRFVDYRDNGDRNNDGDTAWRETHASIEEQVLEYEWDHSYYSYLRSGAFIEYLRATSGMAKVKDLYCESVTCDWGELGERFEAIFGVSVAEAEHDFLSRYFP